MPWTSALLLVSHFAAIAASVLVFRAALRRGGPPPPVPAARPTGQTQATRDYDSVIAELAKLDQAHTAGQLPDEEHASRRRALLVEAKHARRSG